MCLLHLGQPILTAMVRKFRDFFNTNYPPDNTWNFVMLVFSEG
jgi:hypothetical protein